MRGHLRCVEERAARGGVLQATCEAMYHVRSNLEISLARPTAQRSPQRLPVGEELRGR